MSSTASIPGYRQYSLSCQDRIKYFERLINVYSFARLFSVLAGGVLVYYTVKYGEVWLTEMAVLLIMVVFTLLVRKQAGYSRQRDFYLALQRVNENEIRVTAGGKTMYPAGEEWLNEKHPYASDLDLFGESSLYAMVNRCATLAGNRLLGSWLNHPAEVAEIRHRQEFAGELAGNPEWKLEFQARLLFSNGEKEDVAGSVSQYLAQSAAIPGNLLRGYLRWLPLVMLAVIVACFFVAWMLIPAALLMLLNAWLVLSRQMTIQKAQRMAGKAGDTLSHYADAFNMIEGREWRSEMGAAMAAQLKNKADLTLSVQVKKLSRLLSYLETGSMSLVGPVLNLLLAWNVRQYFAIEHWKKENSYYLEHAFSVLAQVEAIVSLSSLRSNYPAWCLPQVVDQEDYTYLVRDAGHPLIPEPVRVTNHFTLDNTRKIDIITGSNMAGKSTFLRTLGVNAVLAFCGAPVCASALTISRMHLFTYMRIKDSLNESTSTFKAELDRLKMLLEVLKGEKVFFLVDEMLRGTNSADKYLGSKAIIEKLIGERAVGIVATHDLQIAQLEVKYPDYIRNFYFDIRVEDNEMLFDYQLKNGECKTFNASLLLERLGIKIEK